jgi:hypothetical protein
MADVGGALLSVVFEDLLKKMTREVLDFFRGRKLADEPFRKMKIAMLSVRAVIEDAEDAELIIMHNFSPYQSLCTTFHTI